MQPASSPRRQSRLRRALVLGIAAAGVLAPNASAAEALTEDGFTPMIYLVPMTGARSCVVAGPCTTASGPWSPVGWDRAGKRSVTVLDNPTLPGYFIDDAILRATLVLQQDTTRYRANPTAAPVITGDNGLQVGGLRDPDVADGPLGPLRDAPLGAFPGARTPGPVSVDVTEEIRAWSLHARDEATGRPGGALGVTSLDRPRSGDELDAAIATPAHPDTSFRPILRVALLGPALAGSEIGSPTPSTITERFVPLSVRAESPTVTQARFEYRIGGTEEWRRIPLEALRVRATGDRLSSEILPVDPQRYSPELTWDLNATPGAEKNGAIDVRALLGPGMPVGRGGYTPTRRFTLQRPAVVTPGSGNGNGHGGETPPPAAPRDEPTGGTLTGPPLVSALPGATPPSVPAVRPPVARIDSSRAAATRTGRITVTVRCSSGTVGCRGVVTATLPGTRSARATVVARARYRAAPGTTASVPLQLGSTTRRVLARRAGGRLTLRVVATNADGKAGPARRVVVRSAAR